MILPCVSLEDSSGEVSMGAEMLDIERSRTLLDQHLELSHSHTSRTSVGFNVAWGKDFFLPH